VKIDFSVELGDDAQISKLKGKRREAALSFVASAVMFYLAYRSRAGSTWETISWVLTLALFIHADVLLSAVRSLEKLLKVDQA
jgi:hypothetical protein